MTRLLFFFGTLSREGFVFQVNFNQRSAKIFPMEKMIKSK